LYIIVIPQKITSINPNGLYDGETLEIDEHVVALDVPVQPELAVHERQRHEHLLDHVGDAGLCHRAPHIHAVS